MLTDPNWSNFLFEEATKVINLIDFGAAQDYPKSFVDDYLRIVSFFYTSLLRFEVLAFGLSLPFGTFWFTFITFSLIYL